MGKIFLSYRRSDCRDHTERIHDRLVRDLKGHHIFLDVDLGNIPGATHYEEVIRQYVDETDVLVAIIGEQWLSAASPSGARRLDDPDDLVRREIALALENDKTKVIPVVALDARLPAKEELPPDLQELLRLHFVAVRRNPDFHRDMDYLVQTIKTYLPSEQRISTPLFLLTLMLTMLLTVVASYFAFGQSEQVAEIQNTLSVMELAAATLTSDAETALAPTLSPTPNQQETIRAIQTQIIATETARAIALLPTETAPPPTLTATPSASPTATASPSNTPNRTATQRAQIAANQQMTQVAGIALAEQSTQVSQLTARAPTNTPRPTFTVTPSPTRTPTNTPTASPTATHTATPSPSPSPTATIDRTATAAVPATQAAAATRVYEQAVATLDAQITATSVALNALQYGEIAYHVDNYGGGSDREIVTAFLDGSNQRALTTNGADDLSPDWSPDGSKIVFHSYRNRPNGNQRDLYIIDLRSGEETQLTDDARVDYAPRWSPDGTQVLYYAYETIGSNEVDIYVVDVESLEVQRLTDTGRSFHPDWSPDGRQIIFSARLRGSGELALMQADGTDMRPLNEDNPVYGSAPIWSPQGEEIAYLASDGEIYLINLDGTEARQLVFEEGSKRNLAWSGDGEWLLFEADIESDFDIFMVHRQGEGLQRITYLSLNERSPAWNPYTSVASLTDMLRCEEGGLLARLSIGQPARVITNLNLNIRSGPAANAASLGQLVPGTVVQVLDGPDCDAAGIAWWQVEYEGITGWISEGNESYWVEPVRGLVP